jgi:DinB superfamily
MPDQSLLLLLDEVRGKTRRILESIPAEDARWAPSGLQNTILWHAGHAYILLEWLTMQSLGQTPQAPEGWFEMFSWESRPERTPAGRWPMLAEVITQLKDQHTRMRRLIRALSDEQLDQPSARNPDRSPRYAILHALHDEACHSGEMHLLRKLRAAGDGPARSSGQ